MFKICLANDDAPGSRNRIWGVLILSTFFGILYPRLTASADGNHFSVHPIRYATSEYPRRLITTEPGAKTMRLDWGFYVLIRGDHKILVDSGIHDAKLVKRWKLKNYQHPITLIRNKLGIQASQITHVIITHHHFDHIGSAHLFPNATVVIQKQEYQDFKKTRRFRKLRRAFREIQQQGRLQLVRGDTELLPGLRLTATRGHTQGSQAVLLTQKDRITHVFVGDECYTVSTCQKGLPLPPGVAYSPKANREFMKVLTKLYLNGAQILPLHDLPDPG